LGKKSNDEDGDYVPPNGQARSEENQLLGHQVGSQDKSDSEDDIHEIKSKTTNTNVTSKKKDRHSEEKETKQKEGEESEPGSPAELDENLEDFANSELEGVNSD